MMPGRSSYEMRTGRIPDLSIFRVMCCQMHAVVRAERDIQARGKLAPVKTACVHLGWDSKRCGYFGYAYESDMLRLSTWRRQECTFNELEMPRVGFIVGKYVNPDGKETLLPSEGQQEAEAARYRKELETVMKEKLSKQPEQTTEDDPENELESPDDEGNPSGARATAQQDPASEGPPSRRLRSMTHGSELISWDSVDPTLECVGSSATWGLCASIQPQSLQGFRRHSTSACRPRNERNGKRHTPATWQARWATTRARGCRSHKGQRASKPSSCPATNTTRTGR